MTEDKLEDCIRPEMRAKFEREKHLYFPSYSKKIVTSVTVDGKSYDINKAQLDKRTPGLFKTEFSGTWGICAGPKCCLWGGAKQDPKHPSLLKQQGGKMSCKGAQQSKVIAQCGGSLLGLKRTWSDAVHKGTIATVKNAGIRSHRTESKEELLSYSLEKKFMSCWYDKGMVQPDGVHVRPTLL